MGSPSGLNDALPPSAWAFVFIVVAACVFFGVVAATFDTLDIYFNLRCKLFGHDKSSPYFLVDYWICRRCKTEGGNAIDLVKSLYSPESKLPSPT